MRDMMMLDHIVDHSLQVCRVATFLAHKLNSGPYRLNLDLIRAAAMLHDITKTRSFETSENHAVTGGQFLAELGYPEVGGLVRQHVKLDEYCATKKLIDADIVNYADKRVLHAEIVDLDRRLDYILDRYAKKAAERNRICSLWGKTRGLETKIFKELPFPPQNLGRLLDIENQPLDLIP